MKKIALLLCMLVPLLTVAAGDDAPIALSTVVVNVHNVASIKRGAQFFASNCMVCHTMRYMQHNKLAAAAGITLDKMPLKNKEWWLGIKPPDLTLIASVHSPDWLYTYFHAFYKDPSRPTGYNNLLRPNSGMTNIFVAYNGEWQRVDIEHSPLAARFNHRKPRYYTELKQIRSGSMTPAQFDQTAQDLVNFLVYAADPHIIERENLGLWVLGFLVIFAILCFFLMRSYWQDIK